MVFDMFLQQNSRSDHCRSLQSLPARPAILQDLGMRCPIGVGHDVGRSGNDAWLSGNDAWLSIETGLFMDKSGFRCGFSTPKGIFVDKLRLILAFSIRRAILVRNSG